MACGERNWGTAIRGRQLCSFKRRDAPVGSRVDGADFHGYDRDRVRRQPGLTLDSFGFSDVSLIKIDVERHEIEVLKGAERTIQEWHPALIVETGRKNKEQFLEPMLAKWRYNLRKIDNGWLVFWRPTKVPSAQTDPLASAAEYPVACARRQQEIRDEPVDYRRRDLRDAAQRIPHGLCRTAPWVASTGGR